MKVATPLAALTVACPLRLPGPLTAIVIGIVFFAAAAPMLAHHSFAAEFDASKALRVTGSLTKIEWTNPHTYFYIDVKEENGAILANIEGELTYEFEDEDDDDDDFFK